MRSLPGSQPSWSPRGCCASRGSRRSPGRFQARSPSCIPPRIAGRQTSRRAPCSSWAADSRACRSRRTFSTRAGPSTCARARCRAFAGAIAVAMRSNGSSMRVVSMACRSPRCRIRRCASRRCGPHRASVGSATRSASSRWPSEAPRLLGRPTGIDGDRLRLDDSVGANIAFGDRASAAFNAELEAIVQILRHRAAAARTRSGRQAAPGPTVHPFADGAGPRRSGRRHGHLGQRVRRGPALSRRVGARRAWRAHARARRRDCPGHLLRRLPVAVDAQVRDHPGLSTRTRPSSRTGSRSGSSRRRDAVCGVLSRSISVGVSGRIRRGRSSSVRQRARPRGREPSSTDPRAGRARHG